MKKECKFYNILFPIWMLILFPIAWIVIVPANFIIDSIVLFISMSLLKLSNKKELYKKHIFKIFLFGMISDIIGSLLILLLFYIFENVAVGDELYLTCPGILLSMLMIFIFNYFITFKNMNKKLRLQLSIIYSLVTAPYTFLIPIAWIY